jgi:fibronectin type III domain-containing protein 3
MNHQTAQQLSHSPSPPNSSSNNNNNNNNSSINNNNINYQNNERVQRQHQKMMRKIEMRHQTAPTLSQASRNNNNNNNKNDNLNGTSGTRRNLQRNGTSSTTSGGGASSVGTSDDGEESSSVPDEEDDMHNIIDYLSSIEAPVVKEIQSHTALVTWEPPPQPTENALVNLNTNDIRYEILLGDRGKDGKYKSIFRGTNLSCRIQDLRAGQEYHVCLSAHLLDGIKGSETEPVVFKTPAREPDIPGQPKVLSKTKNSIQLRWNAPSDNGSHIIHYILEMSTGDHDGEFSEVCKTKGKQFSVPKLTPATWYTFRLAAVNECGRSDYSPPISYNTDGYPPPQPLAPRVHNVTTSSITLLWNRRREDGDFILQMSQQGSGYGPVYYGPEMINECSRLSRATSYQFRLASKTEAGQSPWSEEITVVTLPEQPGRPSKPQVKGKIHAYNFKVKWDPPHDRGGADIKFYHLEIRSGGIFERIYSGPQPEANCERLSPGTTYQVRVLCEGPGGMSSPSDTSTITTEAIVPNAPKTPYYSNLPGPYAAVLQWEKPHYQGGAPVTEYELELEGVLNDGVEKKRQRTIVYRGKEPYCVVKDLLPGESYTTHVRAVNRIGAGEWSEEFSFRSGSAPPSKPLAPEIQVRSATNLLVKWQETQCNGAPILDYKLESSWKQEEDAFSVVYHGTETSADLKDLLPFTTYFFRLHAVNASGRSPNSPTVSQKTPAAVPGIPSLLSDLFVITSNSAHFFWREPESNGDAIINYVLECGDRQITTGKNQTDLLVEHLNSEQLYKVRVQAVNSIGAGAFCLSHKITTKPLPPKPPRLECIQYGYNSLKLKWGSDGSPAASSKGGANVMDFQRFYVEMKIKSSSKDFQNIYTGTRNSIKVQKLHESTDYAFRISAQTEHAGMGAWSDEYFFRTQAAQPNGVKIVKCIESFPVISSSVASEPPHIDMLPSLTVEWQHSKNNHFNDSVEYILQKANAANVNSKNLQFEEVSGI